MSAYTDVLRRSVDGIGDWADLPFFRDGGFDAVITALEGEQDRVLPPPNRVFRALERVQKTDVRVVILGQDPYPTAGHAHGLAFSVAEDVTPFPRSLINIFKELEDDLNVDATSGSLLNWAKQGVLLLNTALTVRSGDAGSHAKIGWMELTDQVVKTLADQSDIAWLLWGRYAQGFRPRIEAGSGTGHLVLESAHPSPLSARRGFFDSKPFSRINNHLEKQGFAPIDWTT